MEAIETELGIGVHGSVGSLAERINLAMDLDGNPRGRIVIFDATNSQRKRLRCGKQSIKCSDLTPITKGLRGSIVFSPAMQASCHAFVRLQLSESDPSLSTIPAFAAYIMNTGTTTGFDYMVATGANSAPSDTTSFILHWVAVEKDFSGTSTSF
jgi:hypothetical protein